MSWKSGWFRRWLMGMVGATSALVASNLVAMAQEARAPAKAADPPPAAATKDAKPAAPAKDGAAEIPAANLEPRDLQLVTKDAVVLHARFFPGKPGKSTVPILLLHGWKGRANGGSSADLEPLARQLHQAGHAVLAPDLRGHGRSVRREVDGETIEQLNRETFRAADIRQVMLDLEASRKFLRDENDAGRLNLEMLCVIGFDVGGLVGMYWIDYDWRIPSLPTLKQGQDVKAFVLVSPPTSFRGLLLQPAFSLPAVRGDLSAMLVCGGQDKAMADDVQRLYNTLRRSHRALPQNPADRAAMQDLFLVELPTTLQGVSLLDNKVFELEDHLLDFVNRRLAKRANLYPWLDRRP